MGLWQMIIILLIIIINLLLCKSLTKCWGSSDLNVWFYESLNVSSRNYESYLGYLNVWRRGLNTNVSVYNFNLYWWLLVQALLVKSTLRSALHPHNFWSLRKISRITPRRKRLGARYRLEWVYRERNLIKETMHVLWIHKWTNVYVWVVGMITNDIGLVSTQNTLRF